MKMNKKGEMISFSDLPKLSIVFLLTAVFFVVGIIILSSFQSNTVTSKFIVNESFVVPAVNGTFQLDHYRLTSLTRITNATGAVLGAGNYTVLSNGNSTIKILANTSTTCTVGVTCLATYTYENYDSNTPATIQNTINALAEIPNNWLLLIAVIVAAAVIIGIVVRNLGGTSAGRQ